MTNYNEDILGKIGELTFEIKQLKARLNEQRRKHEEDLYQYITSNEIKEKENQELMSIWDSAQDLITLKNDKLEYLFVNKAFRELLNLPASKIISKTDKELLGKLIFSKSQKTDVITLEGKTVEIDQTFKMNGRMEIFHIVKTPVKNNFGKIIGICAIGRNVSKFKKNDSQKDCSEKTPEKPIREEIFVKDVDYL